MLGEDPPGFSIHEVASATRGAHLTAAAVDDPDVYFHENYTCGTSRNYTDYCSEQTDKLIDQQSQERDRDRRVRLVRAHAGRLARPLSLVARSRSTSGRASGMLGGFQSISGRRPWR